MWAEDFFCGLKLILSNCMYNTKNLNLFSACNVFCIRDFKKIKALTCFKVYVRYKGNRFFLHSRTIFKYQVKAYGVKCINYTCLSRLLWPTHSIYLSSFRLAMLTRKVKVDLVINVSHFELVLKGLPIHMCKTYHV